jgi:hypothetical protein
MKMKAAPAVLIVSLLTLGVTSQDPLQDLEAKIQANEAKLKAVLGIRQFAEKNKLTKLHPNNVDELSQIYQRQ